MAVSEDPISVRTGSPVRWRRFTTCALASTALVVSGSIALAGAADAAGSAPVYVSTSGSDHPGCGDTLSNQCGTIQYAIDQSAAGSTIQVAAGTYTAEVDITKGVTVQGAGAGQTIISGLGVPLTNGLVNITEPGGDVTISGVTVTDAQLGSTGYQPYGITVNDANPADHVTISDSAFPGNPNSTQYNDDDPIGIDTANTKATQTITGNSFSGEFQAILLEGAGGPIDVNHNTFTGLIPETDGGTDYYPAEGVYVLSDAATNATMENISDNSFTGYAGLGIKYSAGYDLGGCTDRTCDGSVAGSITGNTFDLDGVPANSTLPSAALYLKAVNAGDALNLTVGGNTGTVAANTQPIVEEPHAGSITVTPGDEPNAIVTDPAPTIEVGVPSSVTTDEDPVTFSGTASNQSGEDLTNARYDITITGTSGITAGQLELQYSSDGGQTYQDVPLQGTASAGSAITGYFGPAAGFTFPNGASLTTPFKLSIPSASAPGGVLTSRITLDQVDAGGTHAAINTLATNTSTTTVVANSAPEAQNQTVHTAINTPVAITLGATDADQDPITYTYSEPANGTLTGTAPNLTFQPDAGFVGSTSFAFTASDGKGGSSTATVTVVVGMAASTLSTEVSPGTVTTGTTPQLTVVVSTTPGGVTVDGGTVTVFGDSADHSSQFGIRGTVHDGKVLLALPKLPAGTETLDISYSGTPSAGAAEITRTISVAKVLPTFTATTSPAPLKASQSKTGHVVITLSTPGVSITGDLGREYFGGKLLSQATVVNGTLTFGLYTALSAGQHLLQLRLADTATTSPRIQNFLITVVKG